MKPILIRRLAADRWCHYVIVQERHAAGDIIEQRLRQLPSSALWRDRLPLTGCRAGRNWPFTLQVPRDLAVEQARNGIAARAMV